MKPDCIAKALNGDDDFGPIQRIRTIDLAYDPESEPDGLGH